MYGTACMMDGMIERIEKELSQKVHVVVTGGCAPIVLPYCKRKMNYDKDLLLKGLWILFQKNKK